MPGDKITSVRIEDTILDVHRPDTSELPGALRADVDAAFRFESANIAESTRLTYKRAWQRFLRWARDRGLPVLPTTPAAVSAYAAHLASQGLKFSTVQTAVAAIGAAHDAAGVEQSPVRARVVRMQLRGIARTIGTYQKQKAPITDAEMRRFAKIFPVGAIGVRDRALLLLWFICAGRRSEPTALNLEDLDFRQDGLYVLFRKTKTDQEGKGLLKPVPYSSSSAICPVRAVQEWIACLHAHGYLSGPLFRAVRGTDWIGEHPLTPAAACARVKHYAKLIGMDPREVSGHSLRAGFATSAARKGRPERAIMASTGHKKFDTVLKYIRQANLMRDSAAVGLLDE